MAKLTAISFSGILAWITANAANLQQLVALIESLLPSLTPPAPTPAPAPAPTPQAVYAACCKAATGGPFITWLETNGPQIMQFVEMLLPLFLKA